MILKDYYQNLPDPKEKLRKKIANTCGVEESTVYKWISGETKNVPKLARQFIAKETGIPENELFPQLTEAE